MSLKSSIEWTDATWNPIRGCTRVSDGCRHCYAERVAARFSGPGMPYHGLARQGPRWTGKVVLIEERLEDPIRWRKPRRIFVNSMSDLFHEKLSNEDIARVFSVMSRARQHTFQVLTKRPKRMLDWISCVARCEGGWITHDGTMPAGAYDGSGIVIAGDDWPLPNVWLGVSAENQEAADERIPLLLKTRASRRFVSAEPLLGSIDLEQHWAGSCESGITGLDWVIVGGESGPGARPMRPDWVRSIRDQCGYEGVAFFFKQWGEHVDIDQAPDQTHRDVDARVNLAGNPQRVYRVGKKAAGRELDGRTWNEFPL